MTLSEKIREIGVKIYLLVINPIEGFKVIDDSPDFLGPSLIIGFGILLRMIYEMIITQKIYVWNKITSNEYICLYNLRLPVIQLIIAMRIVETIILLLAIFAVYYFFSYIFRGEGDSYTFFSAIGYMFIAQLINFLLGLISLIILYPSLPKLMLIYNNDPLDKNIDVFGYRIWFEESLYRLQEIISFLGWFSSIWSALLGIILLHIVRKIDWRKAVIGGVLAYTISSMISMFIQSIFG